MDDNQRSVAYFALWDGIKNHAEFVVCLMNRGKIEHARRILNGKEIRKRHVMGVIIKSVARYNRSWSFHLAPESIDFFEVAMEVCDANVAYVEENITEVGGSFLPDYRWCPWSSTLVREIVMK